MCTSTEMYYFVLFRKLHGLVGQTFHHLLGRQVKMKEEQLISAENTVGYNSKKMQIGQELPSYSQRIKSNYPDFFKWRSFKGSLEVKQKFT